MREGKVEICTLNRFVRMSIIEPCTHFWITALARGQNHVTARPLMDECIYLWLPCGSLATPCRHSDRWIGLNDFIFETAWTDNAVIICPRGDAIADSGGDCDVMREGKLQKIVDIPCCWHKKVVSKQSGPM